MPVWLQATKQKQSHRVVNLAFLWKMTNGVRQKANLSSNLHSEINDDKQTC